MRQALGLLLLVLALGALLTACSSSGTGSTTGTAVATGKGPSMAIDQEVLDYGQVKFEQWVRPVFQIRNVGNADLNITRVTLKTLEGC